MDPAQWERALTALRQAVGGEASMLFHRDSTVSMRHSEYLARSDWDSDAMAACQAHYGGIDIRTPFVARTPIGRVHADDQFMSYSEVTRTEIFADFYRPRGLRRSMATKLFASGGRHGLVSVHRAIGNGPFPSEAVMLFEWLAPHIVRALQLQRQVQRAQAIASGLSLMLDHFPMAVALVDETARAIEFNRAAEALLRDSASPLKLSAGCLCAANIRFSCDLATAIARAARPSVDQAPDILRLPKSDRSGSIGVMAVPARPAGTVRVVAERLALVFLSDPKQDRSVAPDTLIRQFGLSPSEAAVAAGLARGDSIEDIADSRGVSREPVRVQLKSLFGKTDTGSQRHLIGVLARSLAALRIG